MLTMHISASATPPPAAAGAAQPDALAACLAQYGVSPGVIQAALKALPQRNRLILCKPTEADAWQIAEPSLLREPPAEGGREGVP